MEKFKFEISQFSCSTVHLFTVTLSSLHHNNNNNNNNINNVMLDCGIVKFAYIAIIYILHSQPRMFLQHASSIE